MRRLVLIFVTLMMLQSASVMATAHGRATSMELSTAKYDWLSNETIAVNVEITNAPSFDAFQRQE